MSKPNYLSRQALDELKEELHDLKFVKRRELSKAIEVARGHGDLSENAEYDAAKEALQHLERRIAQMEQTVATARPMEDLDVPEDTCYLGATVQLLDLEDEFEETYKLVAPPEADPARGRLSVESPIGKGLLGKRAGDEVDIAIPAGNVRYRVLSVQRCPPFGGYLCFTGTYSSPSFVLHVGILNPAGTRKRRLPRHRGPAVGISASGIAPLVLIDRSASSGG